MLASSASRVNLCIQFRIANVASVSVLKMNMHMETIVCT